MKNDEVQEAGKWTAFLAMTETGLGSLLHAYRVPLAGHFLSLNQCFLLCRASQSPLISTRALPFQISVAAAVLKSLSPAGKRLTPMLAISMQGLLFNSGTYLFGRGWLGLSVGSALLSLWAFLQPVLLYLLIFGQNMIAVADYFLVGLSSIIPVTMDTILIAVFSLVLIKLCLAISISWLALQKTDAEAEAYFQKMSFVYFSNNRVKGKGAQVLSLREKLLLPLKDMLQPWFIGSLLLTVVFFCLKNPVGVGLVWSLLRPMAVGFIVFYLLRFLPVEDWLARQGEGSQNSILRQAASQALRHMKEDKSNGNA